MAHPQETREKLRCSYVFNRLSLEIASAQVGISFATARRWKKNSLDSGDDWDKQRSAHMLAGGTVEDVSRDLLSGLVMQFKTTMDAINSINIADVETDKRLAILKSRVEMLASLSDAYNKSVSASKRLLPETSQLATALDVLQKLGSFISEQYPQYLGVFAEVLEPFGDVIERSYG